MYNPPSETNWYQTGWFMDDYKQAYDEGYAAAQGGDSRDTCPYEELHPHERCTSFTEELEYWWCSGYSAFAE